MALQLRENFYWPDRLACNFAFLSAATPNQTVAPRDGILRAVDYFISPEAVKRF
jgi:hypothetical protein